MKKQIVELTPDMILMSGGVTRGEFCAEFDLKGKIIINKENYLREMNGRPPLVVVDTPSVDQ